MYIARKLIAELSGESTKVTQKLSRIS